MMSMPLSPLERKGGWGGVEEKRVKGDEWRDTATSERAEGAH